MAKRKSSDMTSARHPTARHSKRFKQASTSQNDTPAPHLPLEAKTRPRRSKMDTSGESTREDSVRASLHEVEEAAEQLRPTPWGEDGHSDTFQDTADPISDFDDFFMTSEERLDGTNSEPQDYNPFAKNYIGCQICYNSAPGEKLHEVSCGHNLCTQCFIQWIKLFIANPVDILLCWMCHKKDEYTNMLGLVKEILPELAAAFERKPMEVAQHPKERIYCYLCNLYILPTDSTTDLVTCLDCKVDMCKLCKWKSHVGEKCAKDEELEQALKLCEEDGGRACPLCQVMVEHSGGCNRVRCNTCGCGFCFVCSGLEIPCDCGRFDDHSTEGESEDQETQSESEPGPDLSTNAITADDVWSPFAPQGARTESA